jgi:hypothetical protein
VLSVSVTRTVGQTWALLVILASRNRSENAFVEDFCQRKLHARIISARADVTSVSVVHGDLFYVRADAAQSATGCDTGSCFRCQPRDGTLRRRCAMRAHST